MAQKKKPKFTTVSGIPCWAASYLEDADSSGLNDEDKKLADDYKKKLLKEGLRLVAPIEGTRNEFNPCPAFGLACDTEDWSAEVMPPDRIVFRRGSGRPPASDIRCLSGRVLCLAAEPWRSLLMKKCWKSI